MAESKDVEISTTHSSEPSEARRAPASQTAEPRITSDELVERMIRGLGLEKVPRPERQPTRQRQRSG